MRGWPRAVWINKGNILNDISFIFSLKLRPDYCIGLHSWYVKREKEVVL